MDSLTSPKVLKALIERHGFHLTKSLGQNFLIDDNILQKIVNYADISEMDKVLEIGPGVGTMTRELAKRAHSVIAIEIDKKLLPVLEETLQDFNNVEVINADILKINICELVSSGFNNESFKIVANLPYYITTPIIMRFLEEGHPFSKMVMLVQKEVAERMAAAPGTKDYGALSVAVQYYTIPDFAGKVPPGVFMPPPKVDSMIIGLIKREKPPVELKDRAFFFRIVKAVFSQRRKTLLNTLSASGIFDYGKDTLSKNLIDLGIDPMRRGETLSLEEFGMLANKLI